MREQVVVIINAADFESCFICIVKRFTTIAIKGANKLAFAAC